MLHATRTASATSNAKEDHEKSVADWGRQMKESLVLQCNGCGLDAKGNKLTLQRRLFNHFHPASVNINPVSQLDEGVSSAAVMDASEDIALWC